MADYFGQIENLLSRFFGSETNLLLRNDDLCSSALIRLPVKEGKRFSALLQTLMEEGRMNDLKRVISDQAYRELLCHENNL